MVTTTIVGARAVAQIEPMVVGADWALADEELAAIDVAYRATGSGA